MEEDADILTAADEIRKTYGDKAGLTATQRDSETARQRADEALRIGDARNYYRWLSIFATVKELPRQDQMPANA